MLKKYLESLKGDRKVLKVYEKAFKMRQRYIKGIKGIKG